MSQSSIEGAVSLDLVLESTKNWAKKTRLRLLISLKFCFFPASAEFWMFGATKRINICALKRVEIHLSYFQFSFSD